MVGFAWRGGWGGEATLMQVIIADPSGVFFQGLKGGGDISAG